MEKKKMSEAHIRATKKYNDKAYFQFLTRFQKEDEERIRNAAIKTGSSMNGFIVLSVLEKVKELEEK